MRKPTEAERWQRYASYLKCCARSGEHDVMEFEVFEKSLQRIPRQERIAAAITFIQSNGYTVTKGVLG